MSTSTVDRGPAAALPAARVRVVVPGVLGRMGRLVARAAIDDARFSLSGATVRPGHAAVGRDIGAALDHGVVGQPITTSLEQALTSVAPLEACGRAVVVDFTTPGNARTHAAICMARDAALVVGTTGVTSDDEAAFDEAARVIPVLVSANMSVGAHLVARLAAEAARTLEVADVEIVELHHRRKKDAPSGTALMLAAAVAEARGQGDGVCMARSGIAPRVAGEIGVFGVRGGDVVGEHTVYLFVDGERVELTHRVSERSIFATGALRAAAWLAQAKPGRYAMADVLAPR